MILKEHLPGVTAYFSSEKTNKNSKSLNMRILMYFYLITNLFVRFLDSLAKRKISIKRRS